MQTYQTPHGVWETIYCRKEPTPESCKKLGAFNEIKYDVTWNDLEVKKSSVDTAGLGLFTTVDIPKGASIYFNDSPMMFPPSSLDVMLTSPKENTASLFNFMTLYGEKNSHLVSFLDFIVYFKHNKNFDLTSFCFFIFQLMTG